MTLIAIKLDKLIKPLKFVFFLITNKFKINYFSNYIKSKNIHNYISLSISIF
jgi:hypothetical protein